MRTMLEIRGELIALASALETGKASRDHAARLIRELAEATKRRPYVRKAQAKSAPMTAELEQRIRELAAQIPDASYMQIGAICRVSVGRVSEVLAGRRESA